LQIGDLKAAGSRILYPTTEEQWQVKSSGDWAIDRREPGRALRASEMADWRFESGPPG
jgi:hypothetical protein